MNDLRQKKLESSMLRLISELIQKRRLKDERIGLVSVTRVKIFPDLSVAKVFVSPFDGEKQNIETMRALKHAAGNFQSQVGRELRLRVTPQLQFEVDNSIKEGDRMIDLLDRRDEATNRDNPV